MDARALISKGESETLEFKESLALKDEIGEGVSALSNTNGGIILVGVNDRSEIIGVQTGKKTLEDLANYIKTNTDNHVFPKISPVNVEGKEIIIIEVKECDEKPVFFKGKAYIRVGKSRHKLSASEIRKLAKESGKMVYWDEHICENAALADIDEEKVQWFLRKAKFERNFEIEPEMPVREALERLELMNGGKLKNAAVLLFAKNPQRFFLQAETRCARFKGTEPIEFIDMKVFGKDIIGQRDSALEFVKEHTALHAKIVGTEREEKWEYPIEAIRESITNSICHRDYEVQSSIQVRIFDDRIEISNPGPLPVGLTVEKLKGRHESILRNPLLGRCFFLIKFVEQWGTGTNRIIKETISHGLPEPIFEDTGTGFIVTFRKYKVSEESMEKLPESERRIVVYIKEKGSISRKECIQLLKVSHATAFRYFEALENKKIIKREGTGKNVHYVLA